MPARRRKSRISANNFESDRQTLRLLMTEHAALLDEMLLLIDEFREHSSYLLALIDALQSGERSCPRFRM